MDDGGGGGGGRDGGGGLFTDDPSADAWDLSELLDFTSDDPFPVPIPWDDDHPALTLPDPQDRISPSQAEPEIDHPVTSRVRKRDPRLVCSNYLAGRVPCACPEMDEKAMEAEEEEARVKSKAAVAGGKKRARRLGSRERDPVVRCQVEECGVDIRELKGYHRRHRICLRCANATSVLVEGESKRYCQQCGKFHVLSDFDEGKRSCRRKLERHNNRRRRKPTGSCAQVNKELQQVVVYHVDDGCGGDAGKDNLCTSSQSEEKDTLCEPDDGRISTPSCAPEGHTVPTESVLSFEASRRLHVHTSKDNSKCSVSPSYTDNRSAYSSVCPTGRISFKLYDWNPAEFPRRLRHQIFQWLSSMPIELEGYIRPGCTILTVFLTMPKFMWGKFYEDPALFLHRFILQPGSMLSGKGTIFVNVDDRIFHVLEDGNAVVELKMEVPAPRLHYIRPIFFEAGKPIEFVACGTGLFQPKLRFLVSFAGKYLACDCSPSCPCRKNNGCINCKCNHQSYKISIPPTEPSLSGPAFIEVENQSGLSNFIPVLIGDKEVCSEMRLLQERADESFKLSKEQFIKGSDFPNSCEAFAKRQSMLSDFVVDIAWLLKDPVQELQAFLTSSQIERLIFLLDFLIQHDSIVILEKTLQRLKSLNDKLSAGDAGLKEAKIMRLKERIDNARDRLNRKQKSCGSPVRHSGCSCSKEERHPSQDFSQINVLSVTSNEDTGPVKSKSDAPEATPLLDAKSRNYSLVRTKHCSNQVLCTLRSRSRPAVYLIATIAVCLGICTVFFHPNVVGQLTVSFRRSLSGS
ncbi:hypothetical protein MLD38_018014 [Melastoma candidum]|uniref:Uncharacterized protein n=1 Tax=Melastoma candidum TaxID=119954 RepID=A0ACB9QW04_9MYRT|nr:hypothetical protein MLD38_018014 [Melastoma candidum]